MKTPRRSQRMMIGLATIAVASAVIFQNCGELRPSVSAISSQTLIEKRDADDTEILASLLKPAILKAHLSADADVVSTQNLTATLSGAGLFAQSSTPPTVATAVTPELDGKKLLAFSPGTTLKTSLNNDGFQSSEYSIVAVLEGPIDGPLFTLNNGDAGAHELSVQFTSGSVVATARPGGDDKNRLINSYQYSSAAFVVAASFATKGQSIQIQVNGYPSLNSVVTTGSPLDNSYLLRRFTIGSDRTKMRLGQLMVFTKALTAPELNALSRRAGESWGLKDLNYIPNSKEPSEPTGPDPQLIAGIELIKDKCLSCHQHGSTYDEVHVKLKGRSKAQISTAISTIGQMSFLNGMSDVELLSISKALQ